jgi:hypothetical protein
MKKLGITMPFWTWAGKCVVCGTFRSKMSGLFCANFSSSRSFWSPCNQVWCGDCYTPHPLDKFYHYVPTDEAGFDWRPQEEQNRFRYARDGDHLLTPFQCDLCTFQNLQMRNPLPNSPKDDLLLCCIRRVMLDSL